MRVSVLTAAIAASLVSACGGEAPSGASEDIVAEAAAPTAAEPVIEGTRAEVEQAWKCQGVISAAFAARTVIKDGLPEEVAGITSDTAMYWVNRAGSLRAPGMSQDDVDMLTASSVRVLATPQAIENALPEIRECLAAQAGG